jgi:hypothetical protein
LTKPLHEAAPFRRAHRTLSCNNFREIFRHIGSSSLPGEYHQ